MKRPFAKPATTHAQQVALLQQRGMVIDDPAAAEFYLQHLNYYRLGAYWLPFEADHATHTFKPSTHFAQVLGPSTSSTGSCACWCRTPSSAWRCRCVASGLSDQLAHQHGPHAHLDVTLAFKPHLWQTNLDKLSDEVGRSDEAFIKHLQNTYSESLPPVWAVCEVMSLGLALTLVTTISNPCPRAAPSPRSMAWTRRCSNPGCGTFHWCAIPARITAVCGTASSPSRHCCRATSQPVWRRSSWWFAQAVQRAGHPAALHGCDRATASLAHSSERPDHPAQCAGGETMDFRQLAKPAHLAGFKDRRAITRIGDDGQGLFRRPVDSGTHGRTAGTAARLGERVCAG